MTTQLYKAKSGAMQYRPVLEDFAEIAELDGEGFCLACGQTQSGCEPDARRYTCESCGARKVYGFEELAIMGILTTAEGVDL